ncbi:MAG: phosphoenolpyruvate carboxykinase (ATP), partial [Methylocystis sp.]|nr:phosphoenolpyruvate carboxykinase (ATP) [Methylocystis sp.]
PIRLTRALLRAALNGSLAKTKFRADPSFGLLAPQSAPGIDSDLLDPVKTWASKEEFAATANKLVGMFRKNFVKFEPFVDREVLEAQPA